METIFNRSEKFNELIFENKHKNYGAYALRKHYKDNLVVALFSTTCFFGLIAAIAFNLNKNYLNSKSILTVPDIDTLIVQEWHVLPDPVIEPELKEKKEVETEKPPKSDDNNYKASDEKVETDIKTNDQLKLVPKGTPDGDSAKSETTSLPEKKENKESPGAAIPFATEMPEFENMRKFIMDNLRYPQVAIENGTKGTVGISFVVELDGTLSDIKIVRGIGDGCEEEALRVVKLMKKWKPGKHNGVPKRVLLTLPVKFKLD